METSASMLQRTARPLINGNLDTNFLKLVAIIAMFCDHFGKTILPDLWILPVIGRIAFPIFAYCLVVGCLYTSDIKRYLLRLSVFALISQPFYVLAFHPTWAGFLAELGNLNIFFTLVVGLAAVYGLKERNWLLLAAMILISAFINLDYGLNGVILMLLIYLLREQRGLAALVVGLWLASPLLWSLKGLSFDTLVWGSARQGFAALAIPFIYLSTNIRPRIPKMFFYAFYPAHLLLIFLIRLIGKI